MKIKFTRTFSVEIDPEFLRVWFDYAEDESPLDDTDEEIAELLNELSDWEIIETINSGTKKTKPSWQVKVERI